MQVRSQWHGTPRAAGTKEAGDCVKWTHVEGIGRIKETLGAVYVWCAGSSGPGDLKRNLSLKFEAIAPDEFVPEPDLREARVMLAAYAECSKTKPVHVVGFSRGAAVAVLFVRLLPGRNRITLRLYAPKRVSRKRTLKIVREKCVSLCSTAYRADLIPFLPPWFRQLAIELSSKKWYWPYRAHMKSARDAAKRRHMIGKL